MILDTNAIVTAMLHENFESLKQLLNLDGSPITLEPLSDDSLKQLADYGYSAGKQIRQKESQFLVIFAERWVNDNLSCTKRAGVLLDLLDALYFISSRDYFTMLLRLGIRLEKATDLSQHSANDVWDNVLSHISVSETLLGEEISDRIRHKTHPTAVLKDFFTSHHPETRHRLGLYHLPICVNTKKSSKSVITCLTKEEYDAVKQVETATNDQAVMDAACALLHLLKLEGTQSTLLATILQSELFSAKDTKRPLNGSILERLYAEVNPDTNSPPTFNLAISASSLFAYTYHSDGKDAYPHSDPDKSNVFLFDIKDTKTLDVQNQLSKEVQEVKTHFTQRFAIVRHCLERENDGKNFEDSKIQFCTPYINAHRFYVLDQTPHEPGLRQPRRTHSTYSDDRIEKIFVYPTWLISSMLAGFNIDINRPLGAGRATPIVEWFSSASTSPLLFKHRLGIEGLEPNHEDVQAIIAVAENMLNGQPTPSNSVDMNNLQVAVSALAEKLEGGNHYETFIQAIEGLILLKPSVPAVEVVAEPVPATVTTPASGSSVAPVIPQPAPHTDPVVVDANSSPRPQKTSAALSDPNQSSKPSNLVRTPEKKITFMTMRPTDHSEGFGYQRDFDRCAKDLYELEIADNTFEALVNMFKFYASDDDVNKEQFAYLKKAINAYLISDAGRRDAIKKLLDNSAGKLDEAARKNYLLYVLALGRSNFKLHTQKGYTGRHNHFTALNDYLHDKPLDESTRRKFGLFQPEPASAADGQQTQNGPQRKASQ